MTSQWSGIDPKRAEEQYRGLQRRLLDLEGALSAQQSIIKRNPGSFAARLGLSSLVKIQSSLLYEQANLLRMREHETVEVSFKGQSYDTSLADVEALGWFLVRFQKLLNALGQAITSGPTRRGPIAGDIRRFTGLQLTEVFPSSFGLRFRVDSNYDLFGESTSIASLRTLFQILVSEDQDALVRQHFGELGERTFRHFRRLLADVARTSDSVSVRWNDVGGTVYEWQETADRLKLYVKRLNSLQETSSNVRRYQAFLAGASLLKRRFEAINFDTGEVIVGKITRNASIKIPEFFGAVCSIIVNEIQIRSTITNETDMFVVLNDIEQADDAPAS